MQRITTRIVLPVLLTAAVANAILSGRRDSGNRPIDERSTAATVAAADGGGESSLRVESAFRPLPIRQLLDKARSSAEPRRISPIQLVSGIVPPLPAPAAEEPPFDDDISADISANVPAPSPPEWYNDADGWMENYQQRVAEGPETLSRDEDSLPAIPFGFEPWWAEQVDRQLRSQSQPLGVNVDTLILGALEYSPHVRAIRGVAPIEEMRIIEADAAFDWHAFVRSTWDDTSDPVGNTLTTGGSPRFRDHLLGATAGVRKLTRHGGNFEISQRLGYQDNNSLFFVPSQQGNAQLSISFTQPLLNGAGEFYNNGHTVLAQLDAASAEEEVARQLQDHLLKVARAYWDVYQSRAILLQKQRLYESGLWVSQRLQARQDVDALRSQVVRAQAATTSRHAAVIRASTTTRNIETQLRAIVNDPQLLAVPSLELLPREQPTRAYVNHNLRDALLTALHSRPEVVQSIKNVRASSIRLGLAEHELLPVLDVVLGTYVAGLQGDSEVGQAFGNQFTQGEPGYSVGLMFEVPLGNRRAKAACARREWEVHRAVDLMRATIDNTLAEVEIAVREVETSYQEMLSKYVSMTAAENEVAYYAQRWQLLPSTDHNSNFLLEDLLDAQERLSQEEEDFVTAQVNYAYSQINMKRATGTLLRLHEISRTASTSSASTAPAATTAARPSTNTHRLAEPPR